MQTVSSANAEALALQIFGRLSGHCPYQDLHTNSSRETDFRVVPIRDGPVAPGGYCHHQSCRNLLEADNLSYRKELGQLERQNVPRPRTQNDSAIMEAVLCHEWPLDEMVNESPYKPSNHFTDHLRLRKSDDTIWMGNRYDSGKDHHAANFRKVSDLLIYPRPPGDLTCPDTFKPGSISRCQGNIAESRFVVYESDHLIGPKPETESEKALHKYQSAAVINWLRLELALLLAMIVDTGNASLHAWFLRPEQDFARYQAVLLALGCDRKILSRSQPCRLPGAVRSDENGRGNLQRILFLDSQFFQS